MTEEQKRKIASGMGWATIIYFLVIAWTLVLFSGCATTTQQLNARWEKLESAAYEGGHNLAVFIHRKTGSLDVLDDEIERLGEESKRLSAASLNSELRSYVLAEYEAKIRGIENYIKEVEPQ